VSRPVAIICTLVAGAVVAFQPPANASLSRHVGDLGAAFVSIVIAAVIIGALLVAIGHPGRLSSGIGAIRPEHVLGGVGGATIVTVSLITVRTLGAGALVALLVTSQLIVAVLIDRFGWLGVHHIPISTTRLLGIALAIGGTILVTRT
jgi:bacterial/archaeal transporter family-2 protein